MAAGGLQQRQRVDSSGAAGTSAAPGGPDFYVEDADMADDDGVEQAAGFGSTQSGTTPQRIVLMRP